MSISRKKIPVTTVATMAEFCRFLANAKTEGGASGSEAYDQFVEFCGHALTAHARLFDIQEAIRARNALSAIKKPLSIYNAKLLPGQRSLLPAILRYVRENAAASDEDTAQTFSRLMRPFEECFRAFKAGDRDKLAEFAGRRMSRPRSSTAELASAPPN